MYTEKVRIYPNNQQKIIIDNILFKSCFLYNKLYDYHEYMYWMYGKSVSRFSYDKKAQEICLGYNLEMSNLIRKYIEYRLDDAYQRFFSGQNNYPKHKKLIDFKSFGTLDLSNTSGCHIFYNKKQIQLTKKLIIRANFTRPLYGKPKTLLIKKLPVNIYYAFIVIDGNIPISNINSYKDDRKDVISIDLGVNKFLTDHLGDYVKQPRFIEYNESKIGKEQQKLSNMVRGSNNYQKQCQKIAKMYERVVNIRSDFHYKLAHYLVTNYKSIICEDLDVLSMLKNKTKSKNLKKHHRLLKNCGFGQFLTILTYMGQKYNCQLIKVDPRYTSQLCSNCGNLVWKNPGEQHICPYCGLVADRDINAARNIYERGMGKKFSAGTAVNGVPTPLVLVNTITIEKK